jgi:hypothetical protein
MRVLCIHCYNRENRRDSAGYIIITLYCACIICNVHSDAARFITLVESHTVMSNVLIIANSAITTLKLIYIQLRLKVVVARTLQANVAHMAS